MSDNAKFTINIPDHATVSANTGTRTSPGDPLESRVRAMVAYWEDPKNSEFWPIGRLLSAPYGQGTLASAILAGIEIPALNSIHVKGRELVLAEPLVLSIATISQWGCIVCKSAHGSGVSPSKERNRNHAVLASNVFWYNPQTQRLFTVSDTCYAQYVRGVDPNSKPKYKVLHEAIHRLRVPTRFLTDIPKPAPTTATTVEVVKAIEGPKPNKSKVG